MALDVPFYFLSNLFEYVALRLVQDVEVRFGIVFSNLYRTFMIVVSRTGCVQRARRRESVWVY